MTEGMTRREKVVNPFSSCAKNDRQKNARVAGDIHLKRIVVTSFLSVSLAVIASVLAVRMIAGSFDIHVLPTAILGIAVAGAILYLRRGGNPLYAGLVLIVGELVVVPLRALSTGMISAGSFHWLLPAFALTGLLLSGWRAWTVYCAAAAEIYVVSYFGRSDERPFEWFTSAFVVTGAQTLGFLGFKLFRESFDKELVRVAKLNQRLRLQFQRAVEAKREAALAGEARTRFLATMSHEIRTPLHAVMGLLELASDEPDEANVRRFVKHARESSLLLMAEVNDILDFTRLDAVGVELVREPFDAAEALRSIARTFAPQADEKEISFFVRVPASGVVIGDEKRFKQIVSNLVSNALKFTGSGSVAIDAQFQNQNEGLKIIVAVTDTGIGIPPDRLESIFDPFSQVDATTARRFGGSGLGLAIARKLVEAMNGSLSVSSQEGQGSRFEIAVVLPRGEAAPLRTQAPSSFTGLRVLIVDDDDINRFVLKSMCDTLGIECVLAEDGVDAVRAAESDSFDCILMDCHMPGETGADAARALRSRGYNRPIFGVTADATAEIKEVCREAGMSRVLTKPLSIATLREVLIADVAVSHKSARRG